MKLSSLTAWLCLALFFACHQNKVSDFNNGLWKIRKIEILKDHQLKKVIDTGYQLWSFKKSLIKIFNLYKLQNTLHVRIDSSSIKSYNTSGALQDEFLIQKLNGNGLALLSKKKILDAEYYIVYYLDKVRDTTAEELERAF
jgi:hypothetical protein